MQKQKTGDFFVSNTKMNSTLVHAKLGFGAENSGKLVSHVKNEAKKIALEQKKDYVLVDGSPGIGCPVISSLSGANLVVLITEASISGLHDLQRVYELVQSFHLLAVCIINKYDLNEEITCKIEEFLADKNIKTIAKLPYDENFSKAMIEAKCIVEYESSLSIEVKEAWKNIKKEVA